MKIRRLAAALMVGLAVMAVCGARLAEQQTELSQSLLRLHVVANSDSEYDQSMKLDVRDAVLVKADELTADCVDAAEAEEALSTNTNELLLAAQSEIQNQGADYPVTVRLGAERFPTRQYDSFTLPAGQYTSLRVIIGEGEGHNWWCVVFPPICLSATSEELTQSASAIGLTESELGLIIPESEGYVLKLKSLEILDSLREFVGF